MSDLGINSEPSVDLSGGPETEDAEFESLLRRVAGTSERKISSPLLPGTVIDDKLRVDRMLGRGGMGAVYLARHLQLSRDVAVKITFGGVEEAARQRLLREAQAIAAINHDNVVTVYDVGTFEGQVFIAMEFVEGGTLRSWLKGKRSWREILGQFIKAGRGLAAAHGHGMVHRDFKPDNVLVGDDGRVRVADFGLARAIAADAIPSELATDEAPSLVDGPRRGAHGPQLATDASLAVGTPAYMAFEQFSGMPPDERSDQFAFCVSLFEGLYGQRPFPGSRSEELVASMADGKIVEAPRGTKVPQIVRRALLRGLSTDPAERFDTMDALLRELQRATSRRGRRIAAATTLAVVSAAAAWVVTDATERRCEDYASLRDLWNDETRAEVRAETLESAHPKREELWRRAEGMIDGYVSEWEAAYLEACGAVPQKRQIALSCLAGRRQRLSELLTAVASDDNPRVVGITANGLESVEPCRPLPDPTPKEAEAQNNDAVAREHWIAAVRHYRADELDAALRELQAIDLEAPGVAGSSRHGMALAMMGDIHSSQHRNALAVEHWRAAIPILVANDDTNIAIQTMISLAARLHANHRPVDEVRLLIELANALLPRSTGRDWLSSKVGLMRARLLRDVGDYERAQAVLQEALDGTDQAGAPGPYFDIELDLARTLEEAGDVEGAHERFAALFDEHRAQLAADHSRVLTLQVHLAVTSMAIGDVARAQELIVGLTDLPLTTTVALPLVRLRAELLLRAGEAAAARDLFARDTAPGGVIYPEDPPPAAVVAELALWQARAGDPAAARTTVADALRTAGDAPDPTAELEVSLIATEVALELGDVASAREHLDRGRPTLDQLRATHRLHRRAEVLARRLGAAAG